NTKVDLIANLAHCTTCTWGRNGSGDYNGGDSWGPGVLYGPDGNTVQATFGAALTTGTATVYTNNNVTVKELSFDSPNTYDLAGAGSFTLNADTGNALINVLQGNHEIQADLILAKDVTVTTAASTSLNINTPVFLNGHAFNITPGSTVNLND